MPSPPSHRHLVDFPPFFYMYCRDLVACRWVLSRSTTLEEKYSICRTVSWFTFPASGGSNTTTYLNGTCRSLPGYKSTKCNELRYLSSKMQVLGSNVRFRVLKNQGNGASLRNAQNKCPVPEVDSSRSVDISLVAFY